MPNAGKSSLFNALTKAGAEAANYPFTTIEPNVAVVPVHDERLERVVETVGASEIVWDTIDFHDIAGLVAGAHEGEGLGNRFLANIRETDAIVHVVRAHSDDSVVHPEGSVDPLRDIETIETELALADLEQAERRIERVAKQAKGGDRAAIAEQAWLAEVIEALRAGRAGARRAGARGGPERRPRPRLADGQAGAVRGQRRRGLATRFPPAVAEHAAQQGARAVAVSSRIEAELAELDDEDAAGDARRAGRQRVGAAARRARGVRAAAADRVLHRRRASKPAQSWHLRSGLSAWHAAGEIHSDIQQGFVRAEVIGWRELVDAGGYAGARERGTLRLEGRDYEMADGDVITVKFTP